MNIGQEEASIHMPQYRSHKKVWALKIKAIEVHRPTVDELQDILDSKGPAKPAATLTPDDTLYGPISVDSDYMRKHDPKVGGYYVVYKDGYKSFSPAIAFEEGYARII